MSDFFYLKADQKHIDALADVNCWLSGFIAGGGQYSPGTHEELRDLLRRLKAADPWPVIEKDVQS